MNLFLLILGLTVLVLSGDWLVRCASSLAVRASIPPVIVGLTIVSIGTSAPEVIASVRAALEGNPGIAIGNVIGSNIANLALILGVAALVQPIVVTRSILRADWPVLMVASLLFAGFAWDGQLENWEGGILCTGTVAMLIMLYYRTRQSQNEDTSLEEEMGIEPPLDKPLIWLFGGIIVASIGLYYGSEWFIEGAHELALQAGVSDHIIGLTVVAFGTSVPELVAS
ncbi:MAG: calcium/sodium antiporter, partial [Flavobacteriales bacterium]|nr:calcium/sodium antiporter [Flavobacteriales bacterium]